MEKAVSGRLLYLGISHEEIAEWERIEDHNTSLANQLDAGKASIKKLIEKHIFKFLSSKYFKFEDYQEEENEETIEKITYKAKYDYQTELATLIWYHPSITSHHSGFGIYPDTYKSFSDFFEIEIRLDDNEVRMIIENPTATLSAIRNYVNDNGGNWDFDDDPSKPFRDKKIKEIEEKILTLQQELSSLTKD